MYPLIRIHHGFIGTYGICIAVGCTFAVLLALFNCKYSKLNRYDLIECAAFIFIGAVVGAKGLYLLIEPDTVAALFRENGFNTDTLLTAVQGGFVFYGGFIGGLIAVILYALSQKKSVWLYLMTIAPAVPLAHAFGRIGCFMAGCCYGVPSERFGIAFTQAIGAPNGIKLFPVQLLESALLLILALIMQIYFCKTKHRHCVTFVYLFAYPVIRIITEQFRFDDSERGIYLGLSTSTWISIAIFAAGLVLLLLDRKKGFPEPVIAIKNETEKNSESAAETV
ncbi:MAG: prolipoprotein diacylglyceryl transferase [Ruminococcus sp.]|nr:prolipoprotein diacylglyceryl transferase [Ruminococcus sp.]